MSDEHSETSQQAFLVIECKTRFHLEGGDVERLRSYRNGFAPRHGFRQKLALRARQAGATLPFDIHGLDDGLAEAAYFFLGAATYCFDSNPGYRYSVIRISARQALARYGVVPLTTALRANGFRTESGFSLEGIEQGSIKFFSKVSISIGIAANIVTIAPAVPYTYRFVTEQLYPEYKEAAAIVTNYIEVFNAVLNETGVQIEHDTPPVQLSDFRLELRPGHDLQALPDPQQP